MIRHAVRVVVGVGVILTLVGAIVVLSDREPRLAATNSVRFDRFVVSAMPGQSVCQRFERPPTGTAAIGLVVKPLNRKGTAWLSVRSGGVVVARGRAAAFSAGRVAIEVDRQLHSLPGATLCVRNDGDARLDFGGAEAPDSIWLDIDRRRIAARLSVDYLREGRETWWALAPTVADRIGVAHASFLRGSEGWIALAAIVAAWTLAGRLLLRGGP